MTCQTCQNTRTFAITVPHLKGPSNCQYQCAIVPWVERLYQCPECTATTCGLCKDRGEYPVKNRFGEHEGFDYCPCEAGRALYAADTQRDLDAATDEAHALYAHYAALANAPQPVAVDDLNARPF